MEEKLRVWGFILRPSAQSSPAVRFSAASNFVCVFRVRRLPLQRRHTIFRDNGLRRLPSVGTLDGGLQINIIQGQIAPESHLGGPATCWLVLRTRNLPEA